MRRERWRDFRGALRNVSKERDRVGTYLRIGVLEEREQRGDAGARGVVEG